MKPRRLFKCLIIIIFLGLIFPVKSNAFSVYAHLAIVDASWDKSIVPLLKEKFPNATADQLREAHSYAYGGSLMPDMGYFPFGSVYFTNLIHYVRTGDFMENLVKQSQNINEYAFALGAISHYLTDKYGHSLATNIAEPIVYPQVEGKFGKVVTYEQDPIFHSRMEFAFDVLQTARGNYASQTYHDFIGFNVAKPVLERAFQITYGQNLDSVFHGKLDLNISTFRWSVRSLLPGLTRTAWVLKKQAILKENPGMTSRKFHARIKRREYFQKYGRERDKPNLRTRITAFLISIAPKIGPLRALKFKPPGPEGEKLFIKAFDTAITHYAQVLQILKTNKKLDLPDMDFDTGKITEPGEYGLADQTYSQMVIKLQDDKFTNLTSSLKDNVLSFYNKADTTTKSNEHKKAKIDWQKTYLALQQIKVAKPILIESLKFPVDSVAKAVVKSSK